MYNSVLSMIEHIILVMFPILLGQTWSFLHDSGVKNLPANAEAAGDVGSIPGSGRSSGGRKGNPLQYSCWKIPQLEEPDGLQFMGSEELDTTEHACYLTFICINEDQHSKYLLQKFFFNSLCLERIYNLDFDSGCSVPKEHWSQNSYWCLSTLLNPDF